MASEDSPRAPVEERKPLLDNSDAATDSLPISEPASNIPSSTKPAPTRQRTSSVRTEPQDVYMAERIARAAETATDRMTDKLTALRSDAVPFLKRMGSRAAERAAPLIQEVDGRARVLVSGTRTHVATLIQSERTQSVRGWLCRKWDAAWHRWIAPAGARAGELLHKGLLLMFACIYVVSQGIFPGTPMHAAILGARRWWKGLSWEGKRHIIMGVTFAVLTLSVIVLGLAVKVERASLLMVGSAGCGRKGGTDCLPKDMGGCGCLGNQFGQYCEQNIETAREYMPSMLAALRRCPDAYQATFDAHRLAGVVRNQQSRGGCERDKPGSGKDHFRSYHIRPDQSIVQSTLQAIQGLDESFAQGLAFQYTPRFLYLQGAVGQDKRCDSTGGLSCFFKPVSTCGAYNALARPSSKSRHNGNAFVDGAALKPLNSTGLAPGAFHLHGSFWYHAQLARFLWRLNSFTKAQVDAAEQESGFLHPILGMVVSPGDNVSSFVTSAHKMRTQYKVQVIFLVAETEEVALKVAQSAQDFDFIYGKAIPPLNQLDSGDGAREGVLAFSNQQLSDVVRLSLLSRCDYFVSSFADDESRLAYMLAVGDKGFFPPYISLQGSPAFQGLQASSDQAGSAAEVVTFS
eukprot:jgi/Mesvir1/19942/Mv13206-RA.1